MSERTFDRERAVAALGERIGAVVDRWYHLGLIQFNSHDDGGDDLILRDELVEAVLANRTALLTMLLPDRIVALKKVLRAEVALHGPGCDCPIGIAIDAAIAAAGGEET